MELEVVQFANSTQPKLQKMRQTGSFDRRGRTLQLRSIEDEAELKRELAQGSDANKGQGSHEEQSHHDWRIEHLHIWIRKRKRS
jgi:hypothetical protein